VKKRKQILQASGVCHSVRGCNTDPRGYFEFVALAADGDGWKIEIRTMLLKSCPIDCGDRVRITVEKIGKDKQ